MRRVSSHSTTDERGMTAVLIAVCATVLFGIGALVVDEGALYQERRELQNGADAAALSLAQDCARGFCTGLDAKAEGYANLNSPDGRSRATASLPISNSVKVVTRTFDAGSNADHNSNTVDLFFAPIIGGGRGSEVAATATASWSVAGGGATLPLTFSLCEWKALTPGGVFSTTPQIIYFHDPTGPGGAAECAAVAGQDVDGDSKLNGGFGWLTDAPNCTASINSGGWVQAEPGNSPPSAQNCDPLKLLNHDVQVPVFDDVYDNKPKAAPCAWIKCYHIYGIATIHITGFQLGGNGTPWTQNAPAPCSSAKRCIAGYFVKFTLGTDGGPIVPGTHDLGTYVVRLTQ
jgi:Putative Flp pilus-assembly TadE/G-like